MSDSRALWQADWNQFGILLHAVKVQQWIQ